MEIAEEQLNKLRKYLIRNDLFNDNDKKNTTNNTKLYTCFENITSNLVCRTNDLDPVKSDTDKKIQN